MVPLFKGVLFQIHIVLNPPQELIRWNFRSKISEKIFVNRIVDFADGACDPIDFPIAPKLANDRLLKQTGMNAQQVDLWEINEAFSSVVLANMKLSELVTILKN